METSTPKKAPRCKQCGGPTKGHAALGSKPGPKNCSNPPWEEDAAGAIGNVVGVIRAQVAVPDLQSLLAAARLRYLGAPPRPRPAPAAGTSSRYSSPDSRWSCLPVDLPDRG